MSYALGDVTTGQFPVALIQGMLRDRGYAVGVAGVWDATTRAALESALGKASGSMASIAVVGAAGNQLVEIPPAWLTALAAVPARSGDSPSTEIVPEPSFPWPWAIGAGAVVVAGFLLWKGSRAGRAVTANARRRSWR